MEEGHRASRVLDGSWHETAVRFNIQSSGLGRAVALLKY